jgi:dienelactone hydrolase
MRKFLTVFFVLLFPGFLIAQPSQEIFELTGNLGFDISNLNGRVQSAAITIGDGGAWPYKAWMVGDPSLTTHTIYRPADLSPFGSKQKLPIVVWGNGGCRNCSGEVRNFLSEIASHGFLILAVGPVINALTDIGEQAGDSRLLLDAIDWAIAENNRQASPYFRKIETTKIAAIGQSCGGLMTLDVLTDSRITTLVLWNSRLFDLSPARPGEANDEQAERVSRQFRVTKSDLQKIHGPIAYFVVGESDNATENAADDFARINHVPVLFASYDFSDKQPIQTSWGSLPYGHYPCTYREPNGGDLQLRVWPG